jgi:hypothetical protein
MASRDDWYGAAFGVVGVWPAIASFLTGAGVLAHQALQWVKFAAWPEMTLRDGLVWWNGGPLGEVNTGALGIDKILNWCLDGSLALWMMLILPVAWVFFWIAVFEALTPKARRPQA